MGQQILASVTGVIISNRELQASAHMVLSGADAACAGSAETGW